MAEPVRAGDVFTDALSRVRNAPLRLPLLAGLWIALSIAGNLAYADRYGSSEIDLAVGLASVFALFIVLWHLTRLLAVAQSGERGQVLPWIVWTIAAALPGLVPYAVIVWGSTGTFSELIIESFVLALGLSLLVPLWVYATGKAIDTERTTLRLNFTLLTNAWPAIAIMLFIVATVDGVSAEFLVPEDTGSFGMFEMMGRATAAAAVSAVATIANLAILVSAWRAVAREGTVG